MKTVKKLLIVCLAVLMLVTMVACDREETPTPGNDTNTNDTTNNTNTNNNDTSNNNNNNEEETSELVLSADKTTANVGQTVTFAVLLQKGEEKSVPTGVTYAIVEGGDHATLVGNTLTIKDTAANGAQVKVNATYDKLTSNVVTVTVSKPLTSLAISSDKTGEINRGSLVTLSVTKTPADAAAEVTWTVVEGADKATIEGNKLFIDGSAIGGTIIKVKATAGTVESNILTFTVALNQQELNDNRFILSFDEDNVVLDKNGQVAPMLNVSVYNANFVEQTDKIVDYAVLSGDEFVSLTANGNACALTALGHGTATIRATIRGTAISETATVKVIVPPDAINLPEMLQERTNHTYSFSMKNPNAQEANVMPFAATPAGIRYALVCQDMTVSFTHKDGSTGDSVATFGTDGITFLKEGEVTVTVSSNSGSRVETTTSYKFNINKGYNISTFEELIALGNDSTYTGSQPINFVVTQKPVGAGKAYGYDIVPAVALKPQTTEGQTLNELKTGASAQFINKGIIINGNRHKIDASQLRVPTADERQANDTWDNPGNLLEITPYTAAQEMQPLATHRVELNDLTIIGNCPINYNAESSSPFGVYHRGIKIGGETNSRQPANYYLTMNNVTTEAFRTGMRLMHIVDGRVNNAKVDNCFGNGFEIGASIIELHNTTYGACGAVGIEVSPEHSDKAGVSQNQAQQITFSGETSFTFFNSIDGNKQTVYMSKYDLVGYSVPLIIQGAITHESNNLSLNQIDHFIDQDEEPGKIGYVIFQFHDLGTGSPNVSQIIYPAWQQGGIINARDLPTDGVDTTHQYIELDMTLTHPLLGTISGGKGYLLNLNYGK